MIYNELIINESIWNILTSYISNQKMPHSMIFHGINGTGKEAHAIEFSALLNCENTQNKQACGTCASCQQIKKMQNPQLKIITPLPRGKINSIKSASLNALTDKETKSDTVLWLENNSPMIFGAEKNKGIRLDGNVPKVVEIGDKWSIDDILVHDESDYVIASLLSNMTYNEVFPDPIGVLYAIEDTTYEDMMVNQIKEATKKKAKGTIQDIINAGDTWVVK